MGAVRYQIRDFEVARCHVGFQRYRDTGGRAYAHAPAARIRARRGLCVHPAGARAGVPRGSSRRCSDDRFIPTVFNAQEAPRLATFLTELQGLLHQRGEALAARAVASGAGRGRRNCRLSDAPERQPLRADRRSLRCQPAHSPGGFVPAVPGDRRRPFYADDHGRRPPETSGLPARGPACQPTTRLITALRAHLSVVLEQNAVSIPPGEEAIQHQRRRSQRQGAVRHRGVRVGRAGRRARPRTCARDCRRR